MKRAFWSGRRVFVTGHTGFKGAWLLLLLERLGARVTAYALPPPTEPSLYALADAGRALEAAHTGDIRELEPLARAIADAAPDVVLHLAAQSVVFDGYADPVRTYATNVLGTVHVLEAVRRLDRAVAVVNVTTDKVYAAGATRPFVEGDALGGDDPYASSKACAELVAQAYGASYFERAGVALASARAGNVVGGGDYTPHQLVPAIVAAAQAGRAVELRQPGGVRPWQHVLDCLHGYLTLAERLAQAPQRARGGWNFGPAVDEVVTVAQVAERLAAHWRVTPAWTRAAGEHPPETASLRLDSGRAQRELGWRPVLDTAHALDWVAQWHLQVAAGATPRDATLAQVDAFVQRSQETV